ncbi:YbgC/FadM family acyl-CoA thioesterase [SAR86 cluster bacterium]|jgi:acyl-CoA thioester hydrolase|nr:YbgC/FadM family acyl-CoA thioesterase [SAR86 cluster bacterium]MDC3150907.1 YbgC/FadM family acyl-CoA thioesterase [SAR86 cluster bacterium]|tara:strand:+ start:170 stop:571 length:402 start_codon:yes stop_codon:yes gene_type:complete
MHSIEYRVYYEDTDAQGVVYYANYLKFCERARTEYLRLLGYEQKELMDIGVIFIVRKVIVEYLKPANLDELIKIETRLNKVKKVSFNFLQTIYNSNLEKICEAEVFCGSISSASKKPTLVPKKLLNNMIKEIS